MTTHHLTSDDMRTYRPDSMGEGRRGITPEQRRELERLIEDARYAMLELGAAAVDGKRSASERTDETQRAIRAYLDEVTDYSTAEAVGAYRADRIG